MPWKLCNQDGKISDVYHRSASRDTFLSWTPISVQQVSVPQTFFFFFFFMWKINNPKRYWSGPVLHVASFLTWSFNCFIVQLVKRYYANSAHSNNESASRRFPILMLNIIVPPSTVDVNLTPDKWQVMLQNKVKTYFIQLHCTSFLLNDIPQRNLMFSTGHTVFVFHPGCCAFSSGICTDLIVWFLFCWEWQPYDDRTVSFWGGN